MSAELRRLERNGAPIGERIAQAEADVRELQSQSLAVGRWDRALRRQVDDQLCAARLVVVMLKRGGD